MDDLTQLPKPGGNRTALIIGIVVVVLILALAAWFFMRRETVEVPEGVGAAAPSYTVAVPEDWMKNGQVSLPEGVKTPAEAVEEVQNIPGYGDQKPSDAQIIRGEDGELYWAIKTDRGITTMKASSTQP